MNYYSYKLDHDYGLAPNPFGQYCTLAVCKPSIRRNNDLEIGDWIIGTGSKKINKLHHLIFTMQVQGKLGFQEYWEDERFQYKKPILNGSLVQMFGDNFYHKNPKTNKWIQEPSAHSVVDREEHKENDLSGKYVLFSEHFYYFGDSAPLIPQEFWDVCSEGRNMKSKGIDKDVAAKFINWVDENNLVGIHGDPINWEEYLDTHNQTRLNI